tara:strand:+ start:15033 stop:15254 length:222 start_codon:yes stop_codon:yes gene_type:complete
MQSVPSIVLQSLGTGEGITDVGCDVGRKRGVGCAVFLVGLRVGAVGEEDGWGVGLLVGADDCAQSLGQYPQFP